MMDEEMLVEYEIVNSKSQEIGDIAVFVLKPQQTLNSRTTVELESILETHKPKQVKHVVLDLSDVSFINSTGIGFTVKMQSEADSQGTVFCLCSADKEIVNTLKMMEIFEFFIVFDNLEEALKSF